MGEIKAPECLEVIFVTITLSLPLNINGYNVNEVSQKHGHFHLQGMETRFSESWYIFIPIHLNLVIPLIQYNSDFRPHKHITAEYLFS